jgi:hypothetical protein
MTSFHSNDSSQSILICQQLSNCKSELLALRHTDVNCTHWHQELSKCEAELHSLRSSVDCVGSLSRLADLTRAGFVCPYIRGIAQQMAQLFDASVGSPDELRALIVSTLGRGPFLILEHKDRLRALFSSLLDDVLARSEQAIHGVEADWRLALIVQRYARLRELRAGVREGMATFVALYSQTGTVPPSSSQQEEYTRFFEDYHAICSRRDNNHSAAVQELLSALGSGVARRMMDMGMELVELVLAWDRLNAGEEVVRARSK